MQHREGIRKMGWAGACLALASSIVFLAKPNPAGAQEADQGGYRHFAVYMSGNELRDGGDYEAWGMARLDLDAARETACYVINWDKLDGAVTAVHLHSAPRRNDGPHWIDFFKDQRFNGPRNSTSGCVRSPGGKILDVINDPSGYYLNVHTTAHKDGAIRGQLF